jgi:flagellar motility protein MotE (MotC chaperone)
MKIRILLSIVVLNIICLGIYLIRPSTVEAENTKAKAAPKQVQVQPQAPVSTTPGGQIDMLRRREEQVKAREMELRELEIQVTDKIKKLEAIEASLKVELEAYKVVAGERVKQLVKIYSAMKPKAAAILMNNLDQDVAVQVILGMKGEIAGGILSYMDPPKAAAISQKLMYFRTGIGAPSLVPSASAAEKAPAEQKTSGIQNPPAAEPPVSYLDDKPPVVAKAPTAKPRATAKRTETAKASAQPRQTVPPVVKPAPEPAEPAPAPAIASAPVLAVASTPVPAPDAPAAVPIVPAAPAAQAPAPAVPASTPAGHALAAGEQPVE